MYLIGNNLYGNYMNSNYNVGMGISPSHQVDDLPKHYSYDSTKKLIAELNSLLKQNSNQLAFLLQLRSSQLQYNNLDWRKSIVPGTVVTSNPKVTKTFNIIMNLKNIYKSHQAMKHFQKALSQSMTPSGPTQAEEQCCICLDKIPTMMLPCYHTFCSSCTQTHIINQQEKKCPVCRAEFHQDNNSLQSRIITVISDEEPFIKDVRQMLLGYLKQLNRHQIKQIQKQISMKENRPNKPIMAEQNQ